MGPLDVNPFLLAEFFLPMLGVLQPTRSTRLVFLPLIPHIERSFSRQTVAPEYIAFADKFTRDMLEGLPTANYPRIAPDASKLVCPWNRSPGLHGYTIRVHLDSLSGDHAVARYEIRCAARRGGFTEGELLQLQRRNKKWYVIKNLDRWIT